jgi:hypothetical protein
VSRINKDAAARLQESNESGMTATAGIMIFESPEPTPPAEIRKAERKRLASGLVGDPLVAHPPP